MLSVTLYLPHLNRMLILLFYLFMVLASPIPWVPEVFLACGGTCRPKADTASAVGRSHERRSREKNLWHGAMLFTVPVDL